MKQLIVDYLPFQITPDQINESMKENNGKLVVKWCFTKLVKMKNQNGRIYPRETLVREEKYEKEFVNEKELWVS